MVLRGELALCRGGRRFDRIWSTNHPRSCRLRLRCCWVSLAHCSPCFCKKLPSECSAFSPAVSSQAQSPRHFSFITHSTRQSSLSSAELLAPSFCSFYL